MHTFLIHHLRRTHSRLLTRLRRLPGDEQGMTTIEYALGSLAAAALAAVLIMVVRDGGIASAMSSLISDALSSP